MAHEVRRTRFEGLDLKAKYIAKTILERLEPQLEQTIKTHLLENPQDWELPEEELHLTARLVGRSHDDNARSTTTKRLKIAPLRLTAAGEAPVTPVEGQDLGNPYPSPVCSTPRDFRQRPREIEEDPAAGLEVDLVANTTGDAAEARRPTGGLRLGAAEEDSSRQLQSDARTFPKRRKINEERSAMKPSTLDKLVLSIWEQLHGSLQLDPQVVVEQWNERRTITASASALLAPSSEKFSKANILCRNVTQASRCCRSLEVIVQAHWVACYDDRVRTLANENPQVSQTKHKMAVLKEACDDFGWTEKDLRNKMAVWRGYHEIEQAGGWAPLVFAGMGLYRYCKYRVDFTSDALARLRGLRSAFEVAADTLHPQWRQLLSIIDAPTNTIYNGHPHDWVVSEDGPVPLRDTYLQWDPNFQFTQLSDSSVDEGVWGDFDPRSTASRPAAMMHNSFICEKCGQIQSSVSKENSCTCFPNLYGGKQDPVPVQVFRTAAGKNNGLMALCQFPRGTAIGEFVGLVTSALNNLDCMQSATDGGPTYQIFQGRKGNFTRFVNHSCLPNSQYERFTWLGLQRIVLVSRGIEAGREITVDYGEGYWQNLDKICRCGESCCRYRNRRVLNV